MEKRQFNIGKTYYYNTLQKNLSFKLVHCCTYSDKGPALLKKSLK